MRKNTRETFGPVRSITPDPRRRVKQADTARALEALAVLLGPGKPGRQVQGKVAKKLTIDALMYAARG